MDKSVSNILSDHSITSIRQQIRTLSNNSEREKYIEALQFFETKCKFSKKNDNVSLRMGGRTS